MGLARFRDPELSLIGVVDELERDKLEEVAHLISDFLHGSIVDDERGSAMIFVIIVFGLVRFGSRKDDLLHALRREITAEDGGYRVEVVCGIRS